MRILVIIPAFNEEKSILKTCQNVMKYKYDFVVINDGSKDKTELILSENNLNHISLINNLGIGGAVQTGYLYAKYHDYDMAIQLDGDGQHNPKYIKKLVNYMIESDADMVIGSRFVNKEKKGFKSTASRRIGIKIISFFLKFCTGKKIYDATSGMRLINRKLISEFSNNYPVEYPEPVSTASVIRKGYRVEELSVEMDERASGVSSIRAWKSIYYMINVCLSIILIKFRRNKK